VPPRVDRVAVAHGACVIVALDAADADAALAALPPAEQDLTAQLGPGRRREFIAGRTALHLALAGFAPVPSPSASPSPSSSSSPSPSSSSSPSSSPVLSDDRGAPVLPAGWVGSISHKATAQGALAAALVAPAGAGCIGVDLERAGPPRQDIARRVLTPRELAQLADLGPGRGPGVTLRFAIKEAIYKAIDPYLRRYVGFTEVELDIAGDAVAVTSALPVAIEAAFCAHAGHWLATARASPR
jgi:enterobactin synthetase component D